MEWACLMLYRNLMGKEECGQNLAGWLFSLYYPNCCFHTGMFFSGNEDMYRMIIGNYEERQKVCGSCLCYVLLIATYVVHLSVCVSCTQELMLENSSLRESLAGMEKQLICLLNERQATLKDQVFNKYIIRECSLYRNTRSWFIQQNLLTTSHSILTRGLTCWEDLYNSSKVLNSNRKHENLEFYLFSCCLSSSSLSFRQAYILAG